MLRSFILDVYLKLPGLLGSLGGWEGGRKPKTKGGNEASLRDGQQVEELTF